MNKGDRRSKQYLPITVDSIFACTRNSCKARIVEDKIRGLYLGVENGGCCWGGCTGPLRKIWRKSEASVVQTGILRRPRELDSKCLRTSCCRRKVESGSWRSRRISSSGEIFRMEPKVLKDTGTWLPNVGTYRPCHGTKRYW